MANDPGSLIDASLARSYLNPQGFSLKPRTRTYCAYLADKAATIISAMARTAEYPLTQPVASLSANPLGQVLESAWRPVVLLQKSEPRWDRSLD